MKETTRIRIIVALFCLAPMRAAAGQTCGVELASVSYTGNESSSYNLGPSLSQDGRFVAFETWASNMVPGDLNGKIDVVVRDRLLGTMELISVTSSGLQGNDHSGGAKISADGRMIAFRSTATNLDPRDPDPLGDVYVHDRVTKTTTLVSERLGSGPSLENIYDHEISADGRYVVFECIDDNVLPGDVNYSTDVFLRDLVTQTTELVSVGPQGQPGDRESNRPSISADGRFVAFMSAATNWFPAAPGSGNGIFVRDRQLGTTVPATMLHSGVLAPGVCWNPAISSDGRYVAYEGGSGLLVPGQPFSPFGTDILRWDRLTGHTVNACISVLGGAQNHYSAMPQLSDDGRFLTFTTNADNLVVQPGKQPMVIWRDMETGAAVVVNEDPQGGPANNWASDPAISGDGRVVAFHSKATDLTPGASGNVYHVYVRACDVVTPATYCKPDRPAGGCVALMGFQGTPSASAGSGFDVRAQGLLAQRRGILFYGTGGPWGQAITPGGYLCIQAPVVRLAQGTTGGTSGCDGSLSMDFNAWIASGADPRLVAGQAVYVQAWFRNGAGKSQLSDALAFQIGP